MFGSESIEFHYILLVSSRANQYLSRLSICATSIDFTNPDIVDDTKLMLMKM